MWAGRDVKWLAAVSRGSSPAPRREDDASPPRPRLRRRCRLRLRRLHNYSVAVSNCKPHTRVLNDAPSHSVSRRGAERSGEATYRLNRELTSSRAFLKRRPRPPPPPPPPQPASTSSFVASLIEHERGIQRFSSERRFVALPILSLSLSLFLCISSSKRKKKLLCDVSLMARRLWVRLFSDLIGRSSWLSSIANYSSGLFVPNRNYSWFHSALLETLTQLCLGI